MDYITKNSGQKVTFILTDGRLYISCTDYAEVFGYNQGNLKSKIENLDFFNLRDREVIYGLLELYEFLIEKFIEKYQIKKDEKNLNTEILQDIIRNNNMTQENIDFLKKSKLLQDIEYSKIELNDENKNENEFLINNNKKNNLDYDNDNTKKIEGENKNKKKFYF